MNFDAEKYDSAPGRSWLEISGQTLLSNYRLCRQLLPAGMEIMAVVKADAYGHGDRFVARLLEKNGVRHFAVSNIDEAIHLRKAGISGEILILGYTPVPRAEELVAYDITQTLLSEDYASLLAAEGHAVRCQFAIDTGMRRIGLNADDPAACERVIRAAAAKLPLEGLFTHLCAADTPAQKAFTERQLALFDAVVERVADLELPCCHSLNSAGGLWYSGAASGLARLGIVLYGLKPDYLNTLPEGIEPAMSWKSVVSMVKPVQPGDTVGYGRAFTVERPMTLATIPTGYADGYSRLLSGRGWVLIQGKRAPIVGRICMDQMMVDVTGIPDVQIGTEVVLLGRSGSELLTADDLAHLYGSIGYEIICGINKRVDRVYME